MNTIVQPSDRGLPTIVFACANINERFLLVPRGPYFGPPEFEVSMPIYVPSLVNGMLHAHLSLRERISDILHVATYDDYWRGRPAIHHIYWARNARIIDYHTSANQRMVPLQSNSYEYDVPLRTFIKWLESRPQLAPVAQAA